MRTFFFAPLRRSRIVARHPRAEFYSQDRKPGLETRALAVDFVMTVQPAFAPHENCAHDSVATSGTVREARLGNYGDIVMVFYAG